MASMIPSPAAAFAAAAATATATTTTAATTSAAAAAALSTAPPTTSRSRPNILITGTPGTGKTSTASLAAETLHLVHVECSKLVVEKKLYLERDEELDTFLIDDDALCDELVRYCRLFFLIVFLVLIDL